jgi:hypothetical protein
MRIATKLMIVLALLMVTGTCAKADSITWTLNDVTFSNGNSLTGTFTTDLAITTFLGNTLTISGPTTSAVFPVATLVDAYLPGVIGIANSDFSDYIDLYLASNLTSAGGVVDIAIGFDCPGCGVLIVNQDTYVDGVLTSSITAPEPSSVLLLGTGLMSLIGIAVLRRRKSAAFIGA